MYVVSLGDVDVLVSHAADRAAETAAYRVGRVEGPHLRDTLMDAGVSAAPVYDARQILADPHFAARAAVTAVPDADFGAVKMPGLVPRFSATPGEIRTTGPEPGAHNDEIYRGLLGLSDAELEQLRAAGAI